MMALSLLAEESLPCDGSGCCKKSNKRKQFCFICESVQVFVY